MSRFRRNQFSPALNEHLSIARYSTDRTHSAYTRILSFCSIDYQEAVVMKICVPSTHVIITPSPSPSHHQHQRMGLFTATQTHALDIRTHEKPIVMYCRAIGPAAPPPHIDELIHRCRCCCCCCRRSVYFAPRLGPGPGRAMASAPSRTRACVVLNNVENLAQ